MDVIVIVSVIIIFIAFFGESMFGFGGGLVAIPLLSLLLGVKDAVTLVLIFQLLMGLLIWKTYRQIEWKVAKPMTFGLIIGTVAGTLLLAQSSIVFLQLFLAIFILIFLIKTFFFNGFSFGSKTSSIIGSSVGASGGLFQGLIGTGGPVLMMYLSVAISRKTILRATLIYLFFITSIIRVGLSIPQGLFTSRLLNLALIALPFFLLAIALGQIAHYKVSEKYYKITIYIILLSASISLLFKSLNPG